MDVDVQAQFDNAQHIVFLTGAGVSTPSGSPTIGQITGCIRPTKTLSTISAIPVWLRNPMCSISM